MAIITEMAMKITISIRMQISCCFSFMSFTMLSLITSMVRVELEAMTREDKVDMEADSTKITTSPIKRGDKFSSMAGITES